MDVADLRQLDLRQLADYLWGRLRLEQPVDPPLGERFDDEEPEQFLIQAVEQMQDSSFRFRLLQAIEDNLKRLADMRAASGEEFSQDRTNDEHLASLAFLVSELDASELVGALYNFACSWFMGAQSPTPEPSFGQTHILRTVAQLQRPGLLELFWRTLWENGPRALRGLLIFGWARAEQGPALARLGELADSRDEIDLPGTVWSLIGPEGPGAIELAKGAANCSADQRDALRQALVDADADQPTLRDFDLHSDSAASVPTEFPWTVPDPADAPKKRPRWAEAVAA